MAETVVPKEVAKKIETEHVLEEISTENDAMILNFMSLLGMSLLGTGSSVGVVQSKLAEIGARYNLKRVNIMSLPTALFIKFESKARPLVSFSSEIVQSYRFDQTSEIFKLADKCATDFVPPLDGQNRLQEIEKLIPRFTPEKRILGYVLLAEGVLLNLSPSWRELVVTGVLAVIVAVFRLRALSRSYFSVLLPSIASFSVTTLALVLDYFHVGAATLKPVIPALVIFLPGGAMATATIELAIGDIVSGASRFMTALFQLVLLTLGMTAAVLLIRLPSSEVYESIQVQYAGFLGAILFASGLYLNMCAPKKSYGWLLAVVIVTFLTQSLLRATLGEFSGLLFASMIATPLCYFISERMKGPPFLILYLPTLWFLVPTAVAVSGLGRLLGKSQLDGMQDFVITVIAIISTGIGTLIGTWIYDLVVAPIFPRGKDKAPQPPS